MSEPTQTCALFDKEVECAYFNEIDEIFCSEECRDISEFSILLD